jgi:AcrR family transcriptional regulator
MPKPLDPEVEKRLLDAARKLLRRGDKNLSIRALAKAARTNTPGIYRRFRSRNDILRAILLRFQQELYQSISVAESLEAATERYIDFALHHREEYELWFAHRNTLLRASRRGPLSTSKETRPSFYWGQKNLAERLGGSPEEHAQLMLMIWSLFHGTAALLIGKVVPPELEEGVRSACRRTVGVLIANASLIEGQ